jgi:(1->4)-alpha-D-glucan 1-alpha-D-glucosylmutase
VSKAPRRPTSTYRIQLRPEFGFDAAAEVTPYLRRLGISHMYTSPVLEAAPGSTHGYDVVDHARVAQSLGGDEAHERMVGALGRAGLGHVVDVVPNHMATSTPANRWWWDVLANGQQSRYASFFDIDWDPPERKLRDKILLPVLGDHYGRVVEGGQLRLARLDGEAAVWYYEQAFPLCLPSLAPLLVRAALQVGSSAGAELAEAMAQPVGDGGRERSSFADLCRDDPELAAAFDGELLATQADPDALDQLLEGQHYRLAWWRTASQELDYRRFLDVSGLVGLRMEDPEVFDASHQLLLGWVRQGVVDGLRIDHPDGLRDPFAYFARLRAAAPPAWIVAEKVLEGDERLPDDWPIAGTTGYDFLAQAGALFVDPDADRAMTALYQDFTGENSSLEDICHQARHELLETALVTDLRRLVGLLAQVCERHRHYRDYTRRDIWDSVAELLACLPVYRTYIREGQTPRDVDTAVIGQSVTDALRRRPELDADLVGYLASVLLRSTGDPEPALRAQQLAAALAAKAVEDTAYYRYLRLVSLNEVGSDPGRFGTTVESFHAWCQWRQAKWPDSMSATSTHDTKRGEDVRIRISLLSEIPEEWADAVHRWREINRPHRTQDWPDANTEYLIYQTLVGASPLSVQRATEHIEKATREAKRHTSWVDPAPDYEAAVRLFVEGILADEVFLADLENFIGRLLPAAGVASLSQTLLKLTAPGVPDFYQGSELWDLSLVDPDNRRAVDFPQRRDLLEELERLTIPEVLGRAEAGATKLLVVHRGLEARRRFPEAFGLDGSYHPLPVSGPNAHHLVAFSRAGTVVTLAPRLIIGLNGDWGSTEVALPPGRWHNQITDADIDASSDGLAVQELLREFPVGLLVRDDATTA